MLDILRGGELPPAIVLHAFSGAAELVPELVKLGAYFSFGTAVADERRTRLRSAVATVPVARILVESDAPDAAMPDTIPATVAKIAQIRGVDTAKMADIIYNNTMGLLNDGKI
jgi:Tat protein secretion system quality control protein TatD with DNase activity